MLDETGGRFERSQPDDRFGRVHRAHLPLWLLEDLYPEDFAALQGFDCFAVLRDPRARFASALAQRIEQFGKQDPFALSPSDLRREVDTVIAFLEAEPDSPALEFCHFIRQRDFVELRGTRMVTHLYRLEDVARLMAEIGARTGHSLVGAGRANRKLDFRMRGLKAPVMAANTVLRKVLPPAVHSALKTRATGLFAREGSKGRVWDEVLSAPDIEAFVAEHYRDDMALVDSVPLRNAAA